MKKLKENQELDKNVIAQVEKFKTAFPPESGGGEAEIYVTLSGLVATGFDDSGEPTGGRWVEDGVTGYMSIQQDVIADDGTWCWDISVHAEDSNLGDSYGQKGFKTYDEAVDAFANYMNTEYPDFVIEQIL